MILSEGYAGKPISWNFLMELIHALKSVSLVEYMFTNNFYWRVWSVESPTSEMRVMMIIPQGVQYSLFCYSKMVSGPLIIPLLLNRLTLDKQKRVIVIFWQLYSTPKSL